RMQDRVQQRNESTIAYFHSKIHLCGEANLDFCGTREQALTGLRLRQLCTMLMGRTHEDGDDLLHDIQEFERIDRERQERFGRQLEKGAATDTLRHRDAGMTSVKKTSQCLFSHLEPLSDDPKLIVKTTERSTLQANVINWITLTSESDVTGPVLFNNCGKEILLDMRPTRTGNSVSIDTTPDLTFTKNAPDPKWVNTQKDLGSDHFVIATTLHTGPTKKRGSERESEHEDEHEEARNSTTDATTITDIEQWTAQLHRAVKQATKEIPEEAGLEAADSKLLHLWEARNSLQEKWRRQRLNRNLRRKIARLDRDIEDHANRLARQQWESTCSSMEGQLGLRKTWNLLRCLLDPDSSKTLQRQNLNKITHTYDATLFTNTAGRPRMRGSYVGKSSSALRVFAIAFYGDDPYAVNKACWTSDVKLLPPKSTAHVVVYLVFSPSQFTADTVQAYKSLEAYDYFDTGVASLRRALGRCFVREHRGNKMRVVSSRRRFGTEIEMEAALSFKKVFAAQTVVRARRPFFSTFYAFQTPPQLRDVKPACRCKKTERKDSPLSRTLVRATGNSHSPPRRLARPSKLNKSCFPHAVQP
ncbi:hypothetical protein HPB47_007902, partial [Ixodes persulcatus]